MTECNHLWKYSGTKRQQAWQCAHCQAWRFSEPTTNDFNPDWDPIAAMVEEQQRMAKRIEGLEQAEKQEPGAWLDECADFFGQYICLNEMAQETLDAKARGYIQLMRNASLHREWQGLTDEERKDIFKSCGVGDRGYVAAMVEAALKDKNL